MAKPLPFDRQDVNEHLALFVGGSRTLARMAMTCSGWWHAARSAPGYRLHTLRGQHGAILALENLRGGLLACGSDDDTVVVREVATMSDTCHLVQPPESYSGYEEMNAMALASLPGGLLTSGTSDGTLRLWEVGTGRIVRTLKEPYDEEPADHWAPSDFNPQAVSAVACLPDGMLASGSGQDDNMVCIWEVETGRVVRKLAGHASPSHYPEVKALACRAGF